MKDTFKKQMEKMEMWSRTRSLLFSEHRIGDCMVSTDQYNNRALDLECECTICNDCGQATRSYIEIEGKHYCADLNMCILHNCSRPGFVTDCKVSSNPSIGKSLDELRRFFLKEVNFTEGWGQS